MRKKVLAATPKPATTKEIILYYQILSVMNLNINTPIPNTTKFDMNVNVFRRLLSLSWINWNLPFFFLSMSTMVPNSCDWFVMLPIRHWTDLEILCNKHILLLYSQGIEIPDKWGCSMLRPELTRKCTKEFFALRINYLDTPSCLILVGYVTHDWCGNTVANLSCQEGSVGCWGLNDSFQVIKEEIEPACCNQVIDEMTDSISPNFDLIQTVESLAFVDQCISIIRICLWKKRFGFFLEMCHGRDDLRLI